jgi:TP901 family phage tail tape measure protein
MADASFRLSFVDGVTPGAKKALSSMERLQGRLGKFNAGVSRAFNAVKVAATVAGVGMTATMGKVISTGMEFEQTLVNASAKFPEGIQRGSEAFQQLEEVAKRVGGTTEFTASQSAQALEFLAMAGFNAQQSMAALPPLVDLATAGNLDLARASDIATDTLGAFGLATKDAAQLATNLGRVNDVLAFTANSANTNIETMFEAFKTAGPVANAAGASIEQTASMIGVLANAGLKGEQAGTMMRNMLLRLQAPPTEAAKALNKLGVTTADASGNFRGMSPVLDDLTKKMDGLGSADRARMMNDIFGMRAIAGAEVLMNAGSDAIDNFTKQLDNAGGTSVDVAGKIRNTTRGSMLSLKSAIEAVSLEIFDLVKGPLGEMIQSLTEWVRTNRELIGQRFEAFLSRAVEVARALAPAFAAIGLAIEFLTSDTGLMILKWGSLLLVGAKVLAWGIKIFAFLKGLSGVIAGVVAVAKVLGLIISGLIFVFGGWAVALVAAIIALGVALFTWWDDVVAWFAETFPNFFAWGQNMIQGLVDGIKSMASGPIEAISGIASGIAAKFKSVLGIASPSRLFEEYGMQIGEGLNVGLDSVPSVEQMASQLGAAPSMGGDIGDGGMSQSFTINVTAAPGATEEDGERLGVGIERAMRRGFANGFRDMAIELGQ